MITATTDLNITAKDISNLTSADALAGFLTQLGYNTDRRATLTPEAIGLAGDSAAAIKSIEVLSEDAEGFLRVVFVQLRSLTAKSRNDLARVLGKTNVDHLLILTSDFSVLEFVLLHKRRRESRGPAGVTRVEVVPLAFAVVRKAPATKELRTIRRFTWTGRDGLEQYDKLRSVFEAAAFTEEYFCNRALFADHYLLSRLREDPAWQDNPTQAFAKVKELLSDARGRWLEKGEQLVRDELYEPLFELLGLKAKANKGADEDYVKPDYLLTGKAGNGTAAAFVYAWDRWLDGPDFNVDRETPEENPGACVVSALEQGVADWIIVTNGKVWRLYSRQAHSRATNFYEVDLVEALIASGDTDPNEAFRYWWLFFRAEAFAPVSGTALAAGVSGTALAAGVSGTALAAGEISRTALAAGDKPAGQCWLDAVAEGSRDYAKRLGERLKERIFVTIFPHLAQGFLEDRKKRLGIRRQPTEEELSDTYEATLTLLYRLLFLLYAEARDLLPIREAPYREASLKKIKEEIAEKAGVAESEVTARLTKAYAADETDLYGRLTRLCEAMDRGAPTLNVPIYNGGLFITKIPPLPSEGEGRGEGTEGRGEGVSGTALAAGSSPLQHRDQRIARFLTEHKVPDRHLALAIDRLARDPDEKTLGLVSIDYKSLEVRHLGSIYEGLLEFKLRVADEDLTTATEKKREKYIPLGKAKTKRGKAAEAVVRKGEVYLSNDKAERKASGSYYTPDPIVKYIVENTVGPVLADKLECLRGDLRKVRKTFDRELEKATAYPVKKPSGDTWEPRDFAAEKTYTEHKDLVERLFDFRTLDPAMGSGHFLVEAVDFITDRLLAFLNQFPINPVTYMLDRTRRNILEALGEQGVAVDPDKLTEVNLLKRHVLKRCIYGVDLNPMAVELAKVSLWLDAFTIGAPLSFLDHHLRCGNSLVGATFKDLTNATTGRLFGIDYAPLLRAIQHVLHVNAMSDATAAEVKQSASEYGEARDELSGYQIVLDLLVAKHFGFPKAPGLLEHGEDLDLSSRSRFMKSLEDLKELALVEKIEELACQSDRRFFHWEIEFPEVFFGFADAEQRLLKHKNEIADGAAGFDAVVGNPPYIRIQTLDKVVVTYISQLYNSAIGKFDIYVPFIERGMSLLGLNGMLGVIVPNKFVTADYGTALRERVARDRVLRHVVDFQSELVFEDVSTYCCLLFMGRRPMETISVARGALSPPIVRELHSIPVSALGAGPWSLGPSTATAQINGVPLKSACKAIYQGLITGGDPLLIGIRVGANAQFQDDLVPFEAGIMRPLLKGPDVHRYSIDFSDHYVIYPYEVIGGRTELIPEKKLAAKYPATFDYLRRQKHKLKERGSATMVYPAWYAHWCPRTIERFASPKIVTQVLASRASFALDLRGDYAFVGGGNAGVYGIIPKAMNEEWLWLLLAVLNSKTFDTQVQARSSRFRGNYFSYARRFIEDAVIPGTNGFELTSDNCRRVVDLVKLRVTTRVPSDMERLEGELESAVAILYHLSE